MSKFRINSRTFILFWSDKKFCYFSATLRTVHNKYFATIYIFFYLTSASRKKIRFEVWYLGNIGSNSLIKLALFVSLNFLIFVLVWRSVFYSGVLPIPIPPPLYGHAVCTPITLLNRPHATYCLVVIDFPHPYPYLLLMYLFFLGEEEDKAFFVKPKRFIDVDKTFRTYS